MKLVNDTVNWLQLYDSDKIPPVDKWTLDHLEEVLGDVIFSMHHCDKYTIAYRAEVTIRRDSDPSEKVHRNQEDYIFEVECPRDGETLRYAGHGIFLRNLPVVEFTVFRLHAVVNSGYLG